MEESILFKLNQFKGRYFMHIVIYRPTVLGFNKTFVTLSKVTQMHFCHKQKMPCALRGSYGTKH